MHVANPHPNAINHGISNKQEHQRVPLVPERADSTHDRDPKRKVHQATFTRLYVSSLIHLSDLVLNKYLKIARK